MLPCAYRYLIPGIKVSEMSNGPVVPQSYPSLSILPTSATANFNNKRKLFYESSQSLLSASQLKRYEMEYGKSKVALGSKPMLAITSAPESLTNGTSDNISNGDTEELTSKKDNTDTKMDKALSFGISRLLGGGGDKKLESGKLLLIKIKTKYV